MTTQYTPEADLEYWQKGDKNWHVQYANTCLALSRKPAVGGLFVKAAEVPSTTRNVKIASGEFVLPGRSAPLTYAGTGGTPLLIPPSAVTYVWLDGAGTVAVGSAFPAALHVPLAIVATDATTVTSIADARVPWHALGVTVPFAATDGATVTFNLAKGLDQSVTIAGNRTLAIANEQPGDRLRLTIKQDATGSRTVTWWSGIRWPGGTVPTLTTTANKEDVFEIEVRAAGSYRARTLGLAF